MIKQSITIGSYVVIKLVTGEEVLGRVQNVDNVNTELDKPRVLSMVAEGQLGLVPYIQLADPKTRVEFKNIHIIAVVHMQEQVKNDYMRIESGILTAAV